MKSCTWTLGILFIFGASSGMAQPPGGGGPGSGPGGGAGESRGGSGGGDRPRRPDPRQ